MTKVVEGFFRTRQAGEAAQNELLSAGYDRESVNFVAGDVRGHQTPAIGPRMEVGAESEAARDAFIGGLAGLAAGAIAVVLPGIGSLIAAGPIAGAIGGLSLGTVAGGIVGLFRDHGISQEEAEFYAEGVRRGGALVIVHSVSGDRASQAEKILKSHGALHIEELAEEYGPRERWKQAG
jgi:hypothetical protein